MINKIFSILAALFNFSSTTKKSHEWRQKSASEILIKIKSFKYHGQIFSYLRKIDPFVMEELILNSLEHREDIQIIRNKKYTGDNGIDGRFSETLLKDGKKIKRLYLIQVKRYSQYINAKDIIKLNNRIEVEKAYFGLFIHTGKSGKAVYTNLSSSGKIKLISGNKLIDLLLHGKF